MLLIRSNKPNGRNNRNTAVWLSAALLAASALALPGCNRDEAWHRHDRTPPADQYGQRPEPYRNGQYGNRDQSMNGGWNSIRHASDTIGAQSAAMRDEANYLASQANAIREAARIAALSAASVANVVPEAAAKTMEAAADMVNQAASELQTTAAKATMLKSSSELADTVLNMSDYIVSKGTSRLGVVGMSSYPQPATEESRQVEVARNDDPTWPITVNAPTAPECESDVNPQAMPVPPEYVGSAEDTCCQPFSFYYPGWGVMSPLAPNMSVFASHTEKGGIGYHHGYSTFGMFFTPTFNCSPRFFPLLDGRIHVFDDGDRWAANAGIGFRYMTENYKALYGINFFYDGRRLDQHLFNRGGVGVERLGARWDLRANGYFPLGPHQFADRAHRYSFPGGFHAVRRERWRALSGADAEIGAALKYWDNCSTSWLYGALGPYYYHNGNDQHHHKENIWGGRARLEIHYLNYIFCELSDTYDNYFHNHFQGTLGFRYPFGNQRVPPYRRGCKPPPCGTCEGDYCCLATIAAKPIWRNEIPVIGDSECCFEVDWCEGRHCDDRHHHHHHDHADGDAGALFGVVVDGIEVLTQEIQQQL